MPTPRCLAEVCRARHFRHDDGHVHLPPADGGCGAAGRRHGGSGRRRNRSRLFCVRIGTGGRWRSVRLVCATTRFRHRTTRLRPSGACRFRRCSPRSAAGLGPGSSGLLVLDWWQGNRSTLGRSDLSGLLVGATLNTRAEEVFHALVEATAFGHAGDHRVVHGPAAAGRIDRRRRRPHPQRHADADLRGRDGQVDCRCRCAAGVRPGRGDARRGCRRRSGRHRGVACDVLR